MATLPLPQAGAPSSTLITTPVGFNGSGTYGGTATAMPWHSHSMIGPATLSDADVERVAQRVVDLLRATPGVADDLAEWRKQHIG